MVRLWSTPTRKSRRRFGRLGFVGTIVIHTVVLAWPMAAPRVPLGPGKASDQPLPLTDALRVVTLTPAAPDEADEDPVASIVEADGPPREAEALDRDPPEPKGKSATPEPQPGPATLRPGSTNARLWRPSLDVSAADLATERDVLEYRLRVANAEADDAQPPTPGTATWASGRPGETRWGASPGVFHLGSVAVPTCGGSGLDLADCGFGMRPGQRLDYRGWSWQYSEIDRQAARAEIREVWRARAAATRSRLESQRDTTGADR